MVNVSDHQLLDTSDTESYARRTEQETDCPGWQQVRHTRVKQHGCQYILQSPQ